MKVKTKIVATLGPASSNEKILRKMILKGLDIVRLNFSHGSHFEHIERINLIRKLNKKLKRAVKIMQDLEGFRIRIGDFKKEIFLKKNEILYLVKKEIFNLNLKEIPFDFKEDLLAIKKGALVYIDDGKIILEVKSVNREKIKTKVLVGGLLKAHKGVNIENLTIKTKKLSEKDRRDLQIALDYNLDYVAQSFVRNKDDVFLIRQFLKEQKKENIKIFAKIENKQAILNLEEIIEAADGIIVARGDLGVCMPLYKVAIFQKEIIKKTKLKNKPVIVATQMLESMVENKIPSRAEVSDITNAILDGADILLLSAETSIGKYPDLAVETMNEIIKVVEDYQKKLKVIWE